MKKKRKTPSNAKPERNMQLYHDFNSGTFSQVELVSKYGISIQRIYEIVKQESIKNEAKTTS